MGSDVASEKTVNFGRYAGKSIESVGSTGPGLKWLARVSASPDFKRTQPELQRAARRYLAKPAVAVRLRLARQGG